MAMHYAELGDEMHRMWNFQPVDRASYERLGNIMYDAVMSIKMDQASDPDGSLGRARFQQIAKAILTEFMNESGKLAQNRFRALAAVIVHQIQEHAEIKPLVVTNTPSDGPAHNHAPAVTVQATGKII